MALKIRNGETIVFIGDSITDCGRRAGERPLGNGYVKLFADMVAIREPRKKFSIINKGIGGNTVVDLKNRWTDDLMRHKPDWLSVKIGINDLHITLRNDPAVTIDPAVFRAAYDDILSRTRASFPRCKMLLIDPFYISREQSGSSFRKEVLDLIPSYIGIVHEMSRKYGTRLVKTHAIFQNLLKYREPDSFCPEPVHPFLSGHLVIAEAVYDALSR